MSFREVEKPVCVWKLKSGSIKRNMTGSSKTNVSRWALYLCLVHEHHLAIEKALKAYVVERTRETPPKTHDLLILMQKGNPPLSEQQQEIISSMAVMGVATRYPENLSRALKRYSRDVAEQFLSGAKEVLACLKQALSTK